MMTTLIKNWILLNILLASVALARGQEQESPRVQALFGRVNSEVSANLQCVANAITLADQLKEAKQKVRALQEKYESAPDKKPD